MARAARAAVAAPAGRVAATAALARGAGRAVRQSPRTRHRRSLRMSTAARPGTLALKSRLRPHEDRRRWYWRTSLRRSDTVGIRTVVSSSLPASASRAAQAMTVAQVAHWAEEVPRSLRTKSRHNLRSATAVRLGTSHRAQSNQHQTWDQSRCCWRTTSGLECTEGTRTAVDSALCTAERASSPPQCRRGRARFASPVSCAHACRPNPPVVARRRAMTSGRV